MILPAGETSNSVPLTGIDGLAETIRIEVDGLNGFGMADSMKMERIQECFSTAGEGEMSGSPGLATWL